MSKLHTLRQNMSNATSSLTVRKVAILSQMAVFKDILPGYRIKSGSTTEEGGVKLSKEVATLRAHESALLAHYQHFLQGIDKVLEDAQQPASLKAVAVKALCGLLEAAPYFNFRLNICKALVYQAFAVHASGKASHQLEAIANAFIHLFKNDALGDASNESVALIAAEIKRKSYKAPASLLKTFEALRLDAAILQAESADSKKQQMRKKAKPFMTKKAKKVNLFLFGRKPEKKYSVLIQGRGAIAFQRTKSGR